MAGPRQHGLPRTPSPLSTSSRKRASSAAATATSVNHLSHHLPQHFISLLCHHDFRFLPKFSQSQDRSLPLTSLVTRSPIIRVSLRHTAFSDVTLKPPPGRIKHWLALRNGVSLKAASRQARHCRFVLTQRLTGREGAPGSSGFGCGDIRPRWSQPATF
jgi:hypothetical protein